MSSGILVRIRDLFSNTARARAYRSRGIRVRTRLGLATRLIQVGERTTTWHLFGRDLAQAGQPALRLIIFTALSNSVILGDLGDLGGSVGPGRIKMRAMPWMLAVVFASGAAQAGEPVTPQALVKTFANGKPFSVFAGQDITMVLNANGTGQYTLKSNNKTEKGKWQIKGSEYCSTWGERQERCFTAEKDGARYNLSEGGKPAGWWQR